ncbi:MULTISPECIES: FeoA family protein [unclassified Lebetimonas]|uniref:FeoA family protein n=1 Tax=unclassified Lebetimonas TaxID=2648158 RepID=UPI0004635679|nr:MULTISPECIES: FeoA family protein [unclassified Lebetimonas]
MRLNELKIGESGIIKKILAKEPLKSRLFSMGFARGEEVKVLKHTLAKNTYEVEVNNIPVALREEEAKEIEVRRENERD